MGDSLIVAGSYPRRGHKAYPVTHLDALEHNRQRSGRQIVPANGIAGTYKHLQLPQLDEGFDELYYVSINDTQEFDELDKRMRIFETAHDYCVLPGIFIVARLDGRSFARLTRERHHFEAPFDERMRDHMVETARHLFRCGFQIVYGYTQRDEISVLFHPLDDTFGRKLRKLNSILAGEASAKFSMLLGDIATFDCRISQLPQIEDVVDYFRWRSEDANRNALNSHC